MRLSTLDRGHSLGTKALFAVIRTMSRQPVLDIIKLVKYRSDFYGKPMGAVTHEAMRGASKWSIGDREAMAAVVAQTNECAFCEQAHAAVAKAAYRDEAKVASILADVNSADVDDSLRVVLRLLQKLAAGDALESREMRAALQAGVSREQIEDALAVFFAFSVISRLADAFGFVVPGPQAMEAGARFLLARGYR